MICTVLQYEVWEGSSFPSLHYPQPIPALSIICSTNFLPQDQERAQEKCQQGHAVNATVTQTTRHKQREAWEGLRKQKYDFYVEQMNPSLHELCTLIHCPYSSPGSTKPLKSSFQRSNIECYYIGDPANFLKDGPKLLLTFHVAQTDVKEMLFTLYVF